ncbi:MAG: hypothetical protein KI791_02355, partial [Cyclobacteriaceae bacterium]|nr:hypothetical protein [Cyclobacteriaceae bacterium SS2]
MLKKLLYLVVVAVLITATYAIYSWQKEEISYNQHIRPIINSKCITCHGGIKKAGGLSFLFREEAL